jgi:Cdc6-like AAA superfamily ATPase
MNRPLAFSFPIFSQALARSIRDSPCERSFVIGLTGPWGSGKTTLMEAVLAELGEEHFLPVRFNAWAHSKQDSIWRALFVSIVAALRRNLDKRFPKQADGKRLREGKKLEEALDDAEKALYTAFTREIPGEVQLDAGQLAKSGVKLVLRFVPWGEVGSALASWFLHRSSDSSNKEDASESPELEEDDIEQLWGIFKRDVVHRHVVQIQSMEQFRASMEATLKSTLNDGRRLIVSVDDVDRCLPEQGLEVFEAVKLYLDLPGSVFLVAMDQDVLQHALDIRYKQAESARRITAELYAEKMIDLTFTIPPSDKEGFRQFISSLPLQDVLTRYDALVGLALPRNPRTWERFANRASLHMKILDQTAKKRELHELWKTTDLEQAFVKLQLLNFRWPAVTRALGSIDNLLTLEACIKHARIESDQFRQLVAQGTPQSALRESSTSLGELPETIWPYLGDLNLLRFLGSDPGFSPEDKIRALMDKMFSLDLPYPNISSDQKRGEGEQRL